MQSTINATPTKLQNGNWGARIIGPAVACGQKLEGHDVTITTRSGKSWTAKIEKVVWRGKDRNSGQSVAIVATAKTSGNGSAAPKSAGRGRLVGTHTNHPCSCGNWSGAGSPCLYGYGEAKDEDEARYIEWARK